MKRYIQGDNRYQSLLFPETLDEYISEDNPVRVIDVFVEELDLARLGFELIPADTGRPAYHPAIMLKLYIYGYLNRIQSSRRLERETQRNVEMMWLLRRLQPDFKTIADFRRDNNPNMMTVRRSTVEHPFATLKAWMGYTHFQMKTLKRVKAEMSLHVLVYNMKRVMNIMGSVKLMETIRA